MSKICPNCLRPVRSGVNYCGYCGTSLVPTPHDPAPTEPTSSKVKADAVSKPVTKAKHVKKTGRIGRSWIKVPITMLVMVILAAMAVRFWPQILVFLGQAVVLLRLT
jgi:hypothetical protein